MSPQPDKASCRSSWWCATDRTRPQGKSVLLRRVLVKGCTIKPGLLWTQQTLPPTGLRWPNRVRRQTARLAKARAWTLERV